MKDQNFLEEDWDYAIILDAARYDVFRDIYDEFFEGDLEKRRSPGSATPEWADKVLKGRRNINWFSANPFINGTGLPISEIGSVEYETAPSDHITNIIDLWDEAWNDETGTVRPEDVNRGFRERIDDISERRTVIHYMQPHAPFIGHGKSRINSHLRDSFAGLKRGTDRGLNEKFGNFMANLIGRIEDTETVMKLGLYSSLSGKSLLEVAIGDTRDVFMNYHRENMRRAMKHAADLTEELDGKVVVTSDHGEAFGENGVWEHHAEKHIPVLVEVPWLEVENVK